MYHVWDASGRQVRCGGGVLTTVSRSPANKRPSDSSQRKKVHFFFARLTKMLLRLVITVAVVSFSFRGGGGKKQQPAFIPSFSYKECLQRLRRVPSSSKNSTEIPSQKTHFSPRLWAPVSTASEMKTSSSVRQCLHYP